MSSFGASRALTWEDREEITACLRRAVVELLAVSKAGKPPLSLFTAPAASDDAIDYTLDVNVNVSNNGQDGALSFQGEDSRRAFCEGLGIEDSSAGRIAADEADGAQTESWQALALGNPELKFAVSVHIAPYVSEVLTLRSRRSSSVSSSSQAFDCPTP